MSIVAGTKFITYNPNLDLKERRSKGPNSETRVYTIEDIVTAAAVTPVTEMSYAASDATTPLVVDTNIGGMFATHDMTVDSVFAGVGVIGTGPGITTIMLQKNGINMLTLPITIDSTEATSLTAATQPILPYTVIAKGDRISTNITTVTGNAAAGLQITLNGVRV